MINSPPISAREGECDAESKLVGSGIVMFAFACSSQLGSVMDKDVFIIDASSEPTSFLSLLFLGGLDGGDSIV